MRDPKITSPQSLLAWMRANGVLHAQVGDIVITRDPSFEERQSAASAPDPEPSPTGDDIVPPEKGVYLDPYLWSEDGDVEVPSLKDVRIAIIKRADAEGGE